jgi:hypothetical protein
MSAATLEPRCICRDAAAKLADAADKAMYAIDAVRKRRQPIRTMADARNWLAAKAYAYRVAADACVCHKPPPSGGATSETRVCVRCKKPILAIEGCTRAGEGWAHLKCRGPISGGAVDDGATPRPWKRGTPEWGKVPIWACDADGQWRRVAQTDDLYDNFPYEANAALIVAAVNSHGALLAACKAARHAFDCDGFGRGNRSCKTCDAAEDQVNAAIALAEGGA